MLYSGSFGNTDSTSDSCHCRGIECRCATVSTRDIWVHSLEHGARLWHVCFWNIVVICVTICMKCRGSSGWCQKYQPTHTICDDDRDGRKRVVQSIELLHKTYGIQHNQLESNHVLVRCAGTPDARPCIVGFEEATDHECPIKMCVAERAWEIATPGASFPCQELIQLAVTGAYIWMPSTPPGSIRVPGILD